MKIIARIVLLALLTHGAAAQTYVVMVKSADEKKWGFVNLQGEYIIKPLFQKCHSFSKDGLALVQYANNKQDMFVNLQGKVMVPEMKDFKMVREFEGGLAPIRPDKLWGYIDTKGKLVIEDKYDDVSYFNDGYAVVQRNGSRFILNAQGQEIPVDVVELKGVRDFTEGLAPFHTEAGGFGYINTEGKAAIPVQFESVGYFTNGLAWAKTAGGRVGFIDKTGDWVIEPQFDAAKDFDQSSGLARIKKDDRWGYVNKSGEITYITDTDVWGDFNEGLSKGRMNGVYGFYDAGGEWVIEPQFEGVRDFKNGYAAAKQKGLWGLVDKKGNWVLEPVYDSIKDVEVVP